jgi:hypothetical protein
MLSSQLYPKIFNKLTKEVVVDRFFFRLGPDLGGCWSLLRGGHCSEVDLVLKLLGRDLESSRW